MMVQRLGGETSLDLLVLFVGFIFSTIPPASVSLDRLMNKVSLSKRCIPVISKDAKTGIRVEGN